MFLSKSQDLRLGVNHLGHFALLGQLLHLLGRPARAARVICVSSLAHRLGDVKRLLRALEREEKSERHNIHIIYNI